VYCHSQLLLVRCPRMHRLVEESMQAYPGVPSQLCSEARGGEPVRVQMELSLSHAALACLIRYLYTEEANVAHLSPDCLYHLFLAARLFEVPRLAGFCEWRLKIELSMDTVIPLLRSSAAEGQPALPVELACKNFFLANYHQCTELQACEALDPRLLCEIMRLHNTRGKSSTDAFSGKVSGSSSPLFRTRDLGDGVHGSTSSGQSLLPTEILANDLRVLLNPPTGADFQVFVQGEAIQAHKFILVARSRYFASSILPPESAESQHCVVPSVSTITPEAFRSFLRFLYASDDLMACDPDDAMCLMDASTSYGLTNHRLRYLCERCVRDSCSEDRVLQLYEASSRLGVDSVRAVALEFIVMHFRQVCQQAALERLDKALLVDILTGIADQLPLTAEDSENTVVPQSLG